MLITEELTRQIHAAMEAAAGSPAKAAALLGMEKRKLYDFIHNNADLRLRWGTSKEEAQPPTEAVTLHRAPMAMRQEAEDIAAALEKEDAGIRRGLEGMGVRGQSLEMAVALQKHARRHFGSVMEMVGGGIGKLFLDILVEVESISRQVNAPGLEPEREAMLREDRSRLLEVAMKCSDKVTNAHLVQQKVRAMKEAKDGKAKSAKPGFTPLVAVHGNNVTITEK